MQDFANGALWGAFIGDAAGARLEFMGGKPNSTDVKNALRMLGGGCWQTAPGQITDDGEMTIALARALVGTTKFPINRVAQSYRQWYLSHPFDIGFATRAALGNGDPASDELFLSCQQNAQHSNLESKANGCLMRASALGVWAAMREHDAAVLAARADCALTHPNETCQIATAAYVIAIRHLLRNPSDHRGAFESAKSVAINHKQHEVIHFFERAETGDLLPFHPQAGFLGIAFVHSFHHLYLGSGFVETLKAILSGGGDTDTNACIAGGLIGALHGFKQLPLSMRKAVENCDVSQGRERPEWLQTKHFVGVAEKLISC